VGKEPTQVGVVWEERLRVARVSFDPLREPISWPPALLFLLGFRLTGVINSELPPLGMSHPPSELFEASASDAVVGGCVLGSQEPAAVPRSGKGEDGSRAYPFPPGRACVLDLSNPDARLPAAALANRCLACSWNHPRRLPLSRSLRSSLARLP
jgi:hypothetical protein